MNVKDNINSIITAYNPNENRNDINTCAEIVYNLCKQSNREMIIITYVGHGNNVGVSCMTNPVAEHCINILLNNNIIERVGVSSTYRLTNDFLMSYCDYL